MDHTTTTTIWSQPILVKHNSVYQMRHCLKAVVGQFLDHPHYESRKMSMATIDPAKLTMMMSAPIQYGGERGTTVNNQGVAAWTLPNSRVV
jgi:hypothetical protein